MFLDGDIFLAGLWTTLTGWSLKTDDAAIVVTSFMNFNRTHCICLLNHLNPDFFPKHNTDVTKCVLSHKHNANMFRVNIDNENTF